MAGQQQPLNGTLLRGVGSRSGQLYFIPDGNLQAFVVPVADHPNVKNLVEPFGSTTPATFSEPQLHAISYVQNKTTEFRACEGHESDSE